MKSIEGQVKEIIHRVKLWYGGIGKKRENGLDDDGAVEAILKLTNLSKDFCDVCWTSSWMAVPKDTPNAQQVKGKDEWVLCQMCEADRKLINLKPLSEKDVETTLMLVPYKHPVYINREFIQDASRAIASRFSKPQIKYPEKKEYQNFNKNSTTGDAHFTERIELNIFNKGYNQAIDDMKALNKEDKII